MWFGRSRIPRSKDVVVSSHEVLHEGLPVKRIIRWHEDAWFYLSGFESDDSEPLSVLFDDVIRVDWSVCTLSLREGQYALQSRTSSDWSIWGPMPDEDIRVAMLSGRMAEQHNVLSG